MPSHHKRCYYVYILGSISNTLYIGVTRSLRHRVRHHQQHSIDGFTATYDVERLLYFERYREMARAISREKQLEGWRRERKVRLIAKDNPHWLDLSRDWFVDRPFVIAPP